MTPKRIADTVMNMAIMGAFAIPVAGPGVAAVIATGMGLFDIFVPDLTTPSGLQNLDKQDLEDAVSEMKGAMADALFNNDVDNATTYIVNFNSDLLATIAQVQTALGFDRTTYFFPNDITKHQLLVTTTAYFAPDKKILQNLLDNRDVITRSSKNDTQLSASDLAKHRTDTTALYCLAGSSIILYLKTAIAWQWANEILYCAAYPKWHAAEQIWLKKSAAYQANFPEQNPDTIYPDVKNYSAPLPDWQDWIPASPVTNLEAHVKELLDYSIHNNDTGEDGLYTVMAANWASRYTRVITRVADTTLYSPPSNPGANSPLMAMWDEVLIGTVVVDEWAAATDQYSLENVAYDDLVRYHDSLVIWQDALDALKFRTCTASDADTPSTVAQRMYNDATLYTKLLDPQGNAFSDGSANISGIRVKCPDLDTKRVKVPDLPPQTV